MADRTPSTPRPDSNVLEPSEAFAAQADPLEDWALDDFDFDFDEDFDEEDGAL
jgi:hypothetical protein